MVPGPLTVPCAARTPEGQPVDLRHLPACGAPGMAVGCASPTLPDPGHLGPMPIPAVWVLALPPLPLPSGRRPNSRPLLSTNPAPRPPGSESRGALLSSTRLLWLPSSLSTAQTARTIRGSAQGARTARPSHPPWGLTAPPSRRSGTWVARRGGSRCPVGPVGPGVTRAGKVGGGCACDG